MVLLLLLLAPPSASALLQPHRHVAPLPATAAASSARPAASASPDRPGPFGATRLPSFSRPQSVAAQALALVTSAAILQSSGAADAPWAYDELRAAVQANCVERVAFSRRDYDTSGVAVLKLKAVTLEGDVHQVKVFPREQRPLLKLLSQQHVPQTLDPPRNEAAELERQTAALAVIGVVSLLPALLVAFLLAHTLNAVRGFMLRGTTAPSPASAASFDEVAGVDGAKAELMEVVDFLTNASRFEAVGARVPRGCLLEGPPGTGKTLLARAVAHEAGVGFLSASGSEFVEMYVGVGASRVRSLFARARAKAPCVLFIDEIDAVGGIRGSVGGSRSDERDQTLNQLLVEMDGFAAVSGVLVLAATNRADMLDPALLRPGRFDRRVTVDLPDLKGRIDILKVHAHDKPLEPALDLSLVAKRTTGFSGAALASLLNEAAIGAARRNGTHIGYSDVDVALDRVTVGLPKAGAGAFASRQRLVAYHEAGHAVAALLTPEFDDVTKVTLLPRTGGAGGFTLFTPSEEQLESGLYSKRYLEAKLAVALGGRVAEEIVFGELEVTTGAADDLQQVRRIARAMVTQWGFASNELGGVPVAWESSTDYWRVSPSTEREIDLEVRRLIDSAFEKCHALITSRRELLDLIADELLERETVSADRLAQLASQHGGAPQPVLAEAGLKRPLSKGRSTRHQNIKAKRIVVLVTRIVRRGARQPLRLREPLGRQARKQRRADDEASWDI